MKQLLNKLRQKITKTIHLWRLGHHDLAAAWDPALSQQWHRILLARLRLLIRWCCAHSWHRFLHHRNALKHTVKRPNLSLLREHHLARRFPHLIRRLHHYLRPWAQRYQRHFPALRRIAAIVMIVIVLGQQYLSTKSLPNTVEKINAQTVEFYPSENPTYVYEHKDSGYSAYFGDKGKNGSHRLAFSAHMKGIDLQVLDIPEASAAAQTNQAPGATVTPSPTITLPPLEPAYASRAAQLKDINDQLSSQSAAMKSIDEKVSKLEKDVQTIHTDVSSLVPATTITHQDAKETVKTTDALPGMDILYTTLADGVKEQIVLRSPTQARSTFHFALSLDGVYFAKPPGEDEWTFFDEETSTELYYFEKPFAIDAKGARTDSVTTGISSDKTRQHHTLTVTVDPSWLRDPSRAYPVMIDPTIRLASAKNNLSFSSSEASDSARMRLIQHRSDKLRHQIMLTKDDPAPAASFKNIENNSKSDYRFSVTLPGTHSEVLLSRKTDHSLGYKLISGGQRTNWVEFTMLNPDQSSTPSANQPPATEDSAILRDQTPTIHEGEFGMNIARFTPKPYLKTEYEAKFDRVKATYTLTEAPPTVTQQHNSVDQPTRRSTFSLPFALTYPWGILLPVVNEDDGSISLKVDQQGDGEKPGDNDIITIPPPVVHDAKGTSLPATYDLEKTPLHEALAGDDTTGVPQTISLSIVVDLSGSISYPVTIDPVAIDTSAIAGATSFGSGRHLIRDNQGNGNLIATYVDASSDIHIRTSADQGQTWTNQVATALTVTAMSVGQDKSGTLHFGTEEASKIEYRQYTITRSNDDITAVTANGTAEVDATGNAHRPSLIVDAGNDFPMMAWSGEAKNNAVVRFSRAAGAPTTGTNWQNSVGNGLGGSCAAAGSCDTLGTIQGSNGLTNHPVLVQMPGIIEPITNQAGNLYIYYQDGSTGDFMEAKATIQTGGTPNFKWSSWATSTIQASDVNTSRVKDLTAARDVRNNRIVFAWTSDADTDSMDTVPVTQIKYLDSSSNAYTNLSPATTFSATGTGKDIGDEFQLEVDPTRNEYLLFYANTSNNIEYRKMGNFGATSSFDWKNDLPTGETNILDNLHMYSSQFGFAVGDSGRIYQWNGTSWTNQSPAGMTGYFADVSIYSPTLAFAGATTGKIFKWNGTSWSNEVNPAGSSDSIYAVDIQSSTLAFAVSTASSAPGRIYKWNGTSWSNESIPGTGNSNGFSDVDVFSSSLAFAAGGNPAAVPLIYKWNGTSWTNEAPASASDIFNDVKIFSSSLAFAVGETQQIYKWNGTSWSNDTPAGVTATFKQMAIISTSLAFAVGGGSVMNIYKWNGTSWSNNSPSGTQTLQTVNIFSASLGYAAGNDGRIFRWNGTSWVNETPLTTTTSDDFQSIVVASPTLVFAVGGVASTQTSLYQWTGGTIAHEVDENGQQSFPATMEMKYPGDTETHSLIETLSASVDVNSERDYPDLSDAASPLVIKSDWDYAHHLDKDSGSDTQTVGPASLTFGRDNTNAYNLHDGFRFEGVPIPQGTAISSASLIFNVFFRTGTSTMPFTIYGEDADSAATNPVAFSAGSAGGLYEWNGSSWAADTLSGESDMLQSIDTYSASGTNSAMTVGANGTIWLWNGTSWVNNQPTSADSSDDFTKVDIYASTLAFAIGGTQDTRASIYKWNGTSWSNENPVGVGADDDFRSVRIFSSTLAFAVGDDGDIFKWNGTSWANDTPTDVTTSDDFKSVDIISSTLAFAVGGMSSGGSSTAAIYKWNGTSWTNNRPTSVDSSDTFIKLKLFSSSLAYAVGGTSAPQTTVYRWDGSSWVNDRPLGDSTGLNDIDVYASTLAIATGGAGKIFRWNGTSWSNDSITIGDISLSAVDVYSPNLAFAVGHEDTLNKMRIYRWDGATWTNDSTTTTTSLNDVSILSGAGDNAVFSTSNSAQFIANRPRTTRSDSYAVNFKATTYRFDVTDLVQEIVCRGNESTSVPCIGDYANSSGNWQSGNVLTLLMISTDPSAANNNISISSLNGVTGQASLQPRLEINVANDATTAYSRGILTQAASSTDPTNNLGVSFSSQNYTDVGSNDAIRADIVNVASASATRVDTPAYYFKKQHTSGNATHPDPITLAWDGQSSLAGSDKTLTMETYNFTSGAWESATTNTSVAADTDATLTGRISSNTYNYYTQEYYDAKWVNDTPSGETNLLRDVDIFSTSLAIAVGDSGRIFRWNGTSWTNDTIAGGPSFYAADMYSATLAYAVGTSGGIYKWNGTSWSNEKPSGESNQFLNVDIFSTTLAYADGINGRIYKWNGTSWSNETPAGQSDALNSVDIFSSTLAYVVGDSGSIWKWNGTSWSNEVIAGGPSFTTVDVYSATLAYAVGTSGGIYKWNGTSWTNETPSGETNTLRSVEVFSSSLAMTVGDTGRIFKWNGTSWTNQTPTNTDASDDFQSVDIISSRFAYAVGGTSTTRASVYKWNGNSWSFDNPPFENNLMKKVTAFSSGLIITVGTTGRIWRYSASTSRYWTYWRVYQAANNGQGALGEGQILRTDLVSWTFNPATSEQMRGGNFFFQNVEKWLSW